MNNIKQQIQEMIHREIRVWNTLDLDLLLMIWHPDMVGPRHRCWKIVLTWQLGH